jgi:putative ABC transport system ATP-binding protein
MCWHESFSRRDAGTTGVITAESVFFSYGAAPILRNISFVMEKGDFILLRGESGCGKSTLLRLLAKLEVPTGGRLLLQGSEYSSLSSRTLRRRVAYLQQLPVMIAGSVRDNLFLSFRFAEQGLAPPSDSALRASLERARLGGLNLDAPAADLSVGQRQRLALIRLLLMNPEVLLLDEPTAALDGDSAAIIHAWLRELHADEGRTILLVTHVPENDSFPSVIRWEMAAGSIAVERR